MTRYEEISEEVQWCENAARKAVTQFEREHYLKIARNIATLRDQMTVEEASQIVDN